MTEVIESNFKVLDIVIKIDIMSSDFDSNYRALTLIRKS